MTVPSTGPEGVDVDPAIRTLRVLGVPMVVGTLQRSPYSPAHQRDRSRVSPEIVAIIEKHSPTYFDRIAPESPEVVHASLLCGENGWWVEVMVVFDRGGYSAGIAAGFPDERWDPNDELTAADLLALWRAGCARTDRPPSSSDFDDVTKFGGSTPGTWYWHPDEDEKDA